MLIGIVVITLIFVTHIVDQLWTTTIADAAIIVIIISDANLIVTYDCRR